MSRWTYTTAHKAATAGYLKDGVHGGIIGGSGRCFEWWWQCSEISHVNLKDFIRTFDSYVVHPVVLYELT